MRYVLTIVLQLSVAVDCVAQETKGDNSPAILGDGNSVIYGVLDIEEAILNFNPTVLSALTTESSTRSFAAALQAPGLARRFFQGIKLSGSEQLLIEFINGGLDPNLLVVSPEGLRESLLTAAFYAKNAGSMIALLNAGASSHGYQDVGFSVDEFPFFLYPSHGVLSDNSFTRAEKDEIVKTMEHRGLFLVLDEGSSVGTTTARALSILRGVRDAPDLEDCASNESVVCAVSSVGCPETEYIPKVITRAGSGRDIEYGNLEWIRKLGDFDGKEYHVYLGPHDWRGYLVLAEFSADFYSVSLFKFRFGANLCTSDGVTYDTDCWRAIELEIEADTGTAYRGGVPSYRAEFCEN